MAPSPRDGFIACVRARRIIDAIDFLRFGSSDAEYEGSAAEGFYAHHDGSGNHHVIAWSAEGVVALDFDHEGADLEHHVPEKDRDPGRWLGGLVGLDALSDRVTEYADKRATGGLWIRGATVHRDGETDQLEPYLLDVRAALEAWNAVVELSTEDLELVVALEAASRRKSTKLTKQQQQRLLDRGDDAQPVMPRGAEMAAKVLAQLGIAWPEAKPKAAATKLTASEKAAAKLGAPQVALLEAVHARSLEATRAALDAGASAACATYRGQFADVYFVESPLVMATRTGDEDVALLLIERGAPMDEIDGVGMHPAMQWAVQRGRVRVVRAMLAAGASVRAKDNGFLIRQIPGCASMLAEAQWRPFLGSIEDFGECLRVLLDAGTSVPDHGSWRAELIQFAEEAGAADLAPRLRVKPPNPRHAEHMLSAAPPVPPLPSVDGSREAVIDLLQLATDRVGDPVGARAALMGAWRLTRNPRIANAIEVWDATSGGRDRIAQGPSRDRPGAAMIVQGFDSALRLPAQPVDAREALDFVELSGVGCDDCSDRCVESAAAVLVHVADVRSLERLRRAVRTSRANSALFGPPRALTDAIASLATFRFAELDEEASALLARVEDVAAERPLPPTNVVPVSELFRAVYLTPDDDAPRRALAERLVARGDPRGEFITLQLDRDRGASPSAREEELFREHGRAWLGDIGWAVRHAGVAFERGFVARAATGRQHSDLKSWHLGYGAPVKFGDEDEWSTIEQLAVGWNRGGVSGLLRSSKLRSLREVVDVLPEDLDDVLAGPPRSWTSLAGYGARTTDLWSGAENAMRVEALPDVFPALSSLALGARDLSAEVVARVVARMTRLRDLSLAYRWDGLLELVAIASERDLRTVRLLLVRVGKSDQVMRSPGDLAVDVATRVITVEMPGRLHDSVAQGAAAALRGAIGMRELVVALPPGARPEGEDADFPELPEAFVRNRERIVLAPLWAIGRALGLPCSVGPEVVPHWSPCTDDLDTFTPPRRGDP